MKKYEFSKELYSKEAFLKAAYNFTDCAYVHLGVTENTYTVKIEMKEEQEEILEQEFLNEMITQMVRLNIAEKTKNIRELLLARALSSTVIDEKYNEEPVKYNDNIDDILKDWFEENE